MLPSSGPGLIFSLVVLLLAQLSRIAVDYWIITWSEKQIPEWQDDTYYISKSYDAKPYLTKQGCLGCLATERIFAGKCEILWADIGSIAHVAYFRILKEISTE